MSDDDVDEEELPVVAVVYVTDEEDKFCWIGGCAAPTRIRLGLAIEPDEDGEPRHLTEPMCGAHALWLLSRTLEKFDVKWTAPEGADG